MGKFIILPSLLINIYASFVVYTENAVVLKGYKDSLKKENVVWQSSSLYSVYYYDSKFDKKYKERKNFKKLEDNDIGYVTELLNKSAYTYEYEITHLIEDISKEDYFYLVDKSNDNELIYRLYLYDISEHALHYIKIVE